MSIYSYADKFHFQRYWHIGRHSLIITWDACRNNFYIGLRYKPAYWDDSLRLFGVNLFFISIAFFWDARKEKGTEK